MNRVAVLGTGLVGGSVGLAARARGLDVTGYDRDPDRGTRALGARAPFTPAGVTYGF